MKGNPTVTSSLLRKTLCGVAASLFGPPRAGDEACDLLLLSMAHCQLGNQRQARDLFEEAVVWMNENEPTSEALIGLRTEVETLITPNRSNLKSQIPALKTARLSHAKSQPLHPNPSKIRPVKPSRPATSSPAG